MRRTGVELRQRKPWLQRVYRVCSFLFLREEFALKSIWTKTFAVASFVAAFLLVEPGFAQKLVDPKAVAPEFREAAEKRRAEQIKQRDCAKKADEAKVLPRDRLDHIVKCLAEDPPKTEATASAHQ
jgi:hypothetical protein